MPKLVLVFNICLALRVTGAELSNFSFTKSFKFGAATASYQIEGGWNASGKGVSNWDYITHNENYLIIDGSTGDVACDSYHRYQDDINKLKELGVNHYRFSISWTRILSTGFIYDVNQDGVDYYNNLINGLLEAGIEPWITMYHWDHPQSIEHLGGWANADMIEYFTDYADLLFSLYGDRVKTWLTINEPIIFCQTMPTVYQIYDSTIPTGIEEYICSYHVLKTHASVYRLYDKKYRNVQKGRISLALANQFFIPASNSTADVETAERLNQFNFGIYAHPLIYGNYPKVVIDVVGNYSAKQGFKKSRLPQFSPSEIQYIKGTVDFLGINHYTTALATANNTIVDKYPNVTNDQGAITFSDPSWETAASTWLKAYPEGFRAMLNWVKNTYQNPEIIITEQGFSTFGELNDTRRINYYQGYLSEALKAIHIDKVRLTGYTAWSLIDNFEWTYGYTVRFGLYYVDYESENKTRIPKESAYFYRNLIKTRCLVDQCVK